MLQPVYHLPWEKGRVVSTQGMLLTGRGYCDIPESYFEKLQKSRKWVLFTKVQVAHSYCLYSSLFQTTVVRLITHAEMLCSRCSQGAAVHSSCQALWFVLPTVENMSDSPNFRGTQHLHRAQHTWLYVDCIKFLSERDSFLGPLWCAINSVITY